MDSDSYFPEYWPANRIIGKLEKALVRAENILGEITSAQIKSLEAPKISGQLTSAQIKELEAAKVAGKLTNSQIESLEAAKLTGQIHTAQIAEEAVSTAKLEARGVIAGKLANEAVVTEKIAAKAVIAGKLATEAVVTEKLAALSVTAAKISVGAIEAEKIASGAVTTAKLAAEAITAEKIAALAVTTGKLAAESITAEKIAALAITTEKLAAESITAEKIAALAITTGKLAAESITAEKIAAKTITAGKLNVEELSAITANLGSITAGTITGATFQTGSSAPRTVLNKEGLTLDAAPTESPETQETIRWLKEGKERGRLFTYTGASGTSSVRLNAKSEAGTHEAQVTVSANDAVKPNMSVSVTAGTHSHTLVNENDESAWLLAATGIGLHKFNSGTAKVKIESGKDFSGTTTVKHELGETPKFIGFTAISGISGTVIAPRLAEEPNSEHFVFGFASDTAFGATVEVTFQWFAVL